MQIPRMRLSIGHSICLHVFYFPLAVGRIAFSRELLVITTISTYFSMKTITHIIPLSLSFCQLRRYFFFFVFPIASRRRFGIIRVVGTGRDKRVPPAFARIQLFSVRRRHDTPGSYRQRVPSKIIPQTPHPPPCSFLKYYNM